MSRSVVFLCTGNACRSQMAEGFARRLLPPDVAVYSAGTAPAGLDPRSVEAMAELDLDISGQRSKSVHEIPVADATHVITLCGGARDACAVTPAPSRPSVAVEHWPLSDPADAEGESVKAVFRATRDEVLRRVLTLVDRFRPEPALGVIGGSGFYALPGLSELRPVKVDTPFGPPSAALRVGRLGDRRVVFLARHGDTHHLLPSEIVARANVYALKRLGVTKVISVSAVGSLREEIEPGHVALPRQFIDRTAGRPQTFFGRGVVAHVSLADPVCGSVADALAAAARAQGEPVHDGKTYLCIEGPQFSTRAESALWRSWGADVIGMTNLPEARLAREAEICYATLALPTDYDCWRADGGAVRVTDVLSVLRANVEKAKRIVAAALAAIDPTEPCACQRALDTALFTPIEALSDPTRLRLHAILARRLRVALPTAAEAGS